MKQSENIKEQILHLTKEYYHCTQLEKEKSNKISYAGRVYDENELINLIDSSLEFYLTESHWTKLFEKKLSNFLDVKYCHFVNSGSSANLLAFMALTSPLLKERQIKRGDEIITVACCFPTTISPIIQYGAVPVFVDVDLETANINVNELGFALTKKTKAVMIAHTLGNPFNIEKVKEFCDKNNLWLIEDNCDALGSMYNNQYTGTFGDIGTSSFYPPHHITTGEGGAVYTNNPLLSKIIKSMKDWGRDCICETGQDNKCNNRYNKQFGQLPLGYDHKYVYSHFGYNLKATEMQAAIGCAQIDKLKDFIWKRKDNHASFKFFLSKEISTKILIQKTVDSSYSPSWFGFLMTIIDEKYNRNDFAKYLEKKGVQTRNLFAGNILKHPCFDSLKKDIDYRVIGDLHNTNKIMNDSLWVGVYSELSKNDIAYIILTIKEFFNE